MKIEGVSAEQFAGVRDRDLCFADGMNVVLGDNESGKSTMIAAVYSAFTVPTKLDRRSDREFIFRSFPTSGADTIDVTLRFAADGGHYTAEKIWDLSGRESQAKLKRQGGDVLRGAQAEQALRELIPYSGAVCDNLVFGRQNHEEAILAWCYDFFDAKSDADIEAVRQKVAEAFSAANGISEERFAAVLDEEMASLAGHWDFERDRPEKNRGIDKPWVNGKGTVLESYYCWQQAERERENAAETGAEITRQTRALAILEEHKKTLEDERDRLLARQGAIESAAGTRQLLKTTAETLARTERALAAWPVLQTALQTGSELLTLQAEKKNRQEKASLTERLENIAALQEKLGALSAAIAGMDGLSDDLVRAKKLETSCEHSRNRLTATKLRADLRLEPGYTAKLLLADGSERELPESGTAEADGYVRMAIPGVAELTVAPANLDVDGLQEKLRRDGGALAEICEKYGVEDVEALSDLADTVQSRRNALRDCQSDLRVLLGGENEDSLRARADVIRTDPGLAVPEALDETVCKYLEKSGKTSLEAAAAAAETELKSLTAEYGSLEALREKRRQAEASYRELSAREQELDDAPELTEEAYASRMAELKKQAEDADRGRMDILRLLGTLSAQESDELPELEAEADRRRGEWEREKAKYRNCERIRKDFEELRAETGDRFAAFYAKFNEYLARITGDRVSRLEADGLQLCSGGNGIPARELLSEGTKKTVLLAFRLAVLSAYLPEGGGLAVLDDDLLDMDPGRRERAAALLQDFARDNQVIFTTCDPAVAALLGGRLIRL